MLDVTTEGFDQTALQSVQSDQSLYLAPMALCLKFLDVPHMRHASLNVGLGYFSSSADSNQPLNR